MNGPDLVVLLAYLTLGVELVCIPVPSVASTAHLVAASRPRESSPGERARALAGQARLVLGTVLIVVLFLVPLGLALWPALARFTVPLVTPPLPFLWAGVGLVVGGRILSLAAALSLRRNAAMRSARDPEPTALLTRGVFRWSRNPVLLGMVLLYAGFGLIYPHALILAGLVLFVLHMHRKVRVEEQVLAEVFGDAYQAYRRRTRRYL